MKIYRYFLCLLTTAVWAQPEQLPAPVLEMDLAQEVLGKKTIWITGDGTVGVNFEQALGFLEEPNLILSVQQAYKELLEEGEEPKFVITEEEPGTFRYENQEGQKTEIVELFREQNEQGMMEVVLYSKGDRSFGPFQTLTHIQVNPDAEDPDLSQWDVQVFAYPENGFSRFFARTFGIAQRYFTRKTEDVSILVTEICLHVIGQDIRRD